VLGQRNVDGETNEITEFIPLLDGLTGLTPTGDLSGWSSPLTRYAELGIKHLMRTSRLCRCAAGAAVGGGDLGAEVGIVRGCRGRP